MEDYENSITGKAVRAIYGLSGDDVDRAEGRQRLLSNSPSVSQAQCLSEEIVTHKTAEICEFYGPSCRTSNRARLGGGPGRIRTCDYTVMSGAFYP